MRDFFIFLLRISCLIPLVWLLLFWICSVMFYDIEFALSLWVFHVRSIRIYIQLLFIYTETHYVLLEIWPLYYHAKPLFIFNDLLCSEVCSFSEILISTPATVWLRHTWYIFLRNFIFVLSESLHSNWVFTWILFCFSNLVLHALAFNFCFKTICS